MCRQGPAEIQREKKRLDRLKLQNGTGTVQTDGIQTHYGKAIHGRESASQKESLKKSVPHSRTKIRGIVFTSDESNRKSP